MGKKGTLPVGRTVARKICPARLSKPDRSTGRGSVQVETNVGVRARPWAPPDTSVYGPGFFPPPAPPPTKPKIGIDKYNITISHYRAYPEFKGKLKHDASRVRTIMQCYVIFVITYIRFGGGGGWRGRGGACVTGAVPEPEKYIHVFRPRRRPQDLITRRGPEF